MWRYGECWGKTREKRKSGRVESGGRWIDEEERKKRKRDREGREERRKMDKGQREE